MSKRLLVAFSIVVLIVSIGIVVVQAASPQKCYEYCRKYINFDQFLACYDGCVHAPQG